MKPAAENQTLNARLKFQAKAVFNSLGLDSRKLRMDIGGCRLSIHGPFKPRRSMSKAERLKTVQLLEEELKKIPKLKGVRLNLRGARKNNGRWTVS